MSIHEHRTARVEAHNGRAVEVEEYIGGDMSVYIHDVQEVYFTAAQADALRSALGKIDGPKSGDQDVK